MGLIETMRLFSKPRSYRKRKANKTIMVGNDADDVVRYAFIGARGSNKGYNVINITWEEVFLRKRRKCSRKHISRRK